MDLKLLTVNKLTNKVKSFSKTRLIILIFVASLCQNVALAQVGGPSKNGKPDTASGITPSTIRLDSTLQFKEKAKGLLRKITQPIKFKSNKLAKEKDAIYRFMLERIQTGQLKIDPATVDQIINKLDQIVSENNSEKELLEGGIKTNEEAALSNEKKIQQVLDTFKIQDKATQSVIASMKTRMSAFVQANTLKTSQEKRLVLSEIDNKLKEISQVKYSTASKLAPIESDTINKVLKYFRRGLSPKKEMMVVGWHHSGTNNEYLKYNYNYLTAINLDGYELSASGKCKNPNDIKTFQKPGGVVAVAQSKGCDVHLTIYNNVDNEIREFLRSSSAQETFMAELDTLVKESKLTGINIYFDCIMNPVPFVSFIAGLHANLKSIDPEIQLNISLPAIINSENKYKTDSYHFADLNPLVDYYIVLSDNLIPRNVNFAQAASPLLSSDKFTNRTVESTFSYYRNTEIPISKLILTVSCLGTIWAVDDFSGHFQSEEQPESIGYADIQEYYLNQQSVDQSIAEGFDPDQVAPFLNIVGPDSSFKEQIWFEDSRSLFLKYNWALDNQLGGVSIRGLETNGDYPELWEALGASLIRIDTTFMDTPTNKTGGLERLWTIITNAFKGFSLLTFKRDLQWARVVRLKYISSDTIIGYKRFDYSLNPSIGSVDDSISNYLVKTKIWDETSPYIPEIKKNYECYLPALSYCYSLYARWTIYAKFFNWCFYLLLALTLLFAVISFNLERYLLQSEKTRNFMRNLPSVLGLFSILFFCFWMFIDPSIKWFGTGSAGGTDGIIMIYILIFGIVFGWFCTYNYYKYKRL